jgi:hypothetical protein
MKNRPTLTDTSGWYVVNRSIGETGVLIMSKVRDSAETKKP